MPAEPIGNAPLTSVEFPRWIRRVAIILIAVFVIMPICMAFAPWQQHVSGSGRVAAFTPLDRPQPVETTVSGRVAEVFVTEGDEVEEGDPLVKIIDIDPEKIARLQAKLDAAKSDLRYTNLNVDTFESKIGILEDARDLAIAGFTAKVDAAREKLNSAQQKRIGAQAELDFALEQLGRMTRVGPQFVAEIKRLEVEAKKQKAEAAVRGADADIAAARAALKDAEAQLGKERELANDKVEGERAKKQSELRKAAETQAKIADLEGELRAQNTQLIEAPRAGRVFRIRVNTNSSIVKSGDVLLEIVPVTRQPAVELWVRGVDAPLIEEGRKVRLQFEGWPAVQFVGWPSAAVGTFGGIVSLVDPTDSGNGRFRLLIVPDPDDEPWPNTRFLRQGVRTKGWVLLDEVRLWFELWRQLNGFPPVVELSEPSPTDSVRKGSKAENK